MPQGSRPDRVGDQIRGELALILAREVHDPGIGFVTLTRVLVTPDLQQARIYFTALGDEQARRNSERALGRAAPFLRRQMGARLRLRRVPELRFLYDESIAGQDRIEQLLSDLHATDSTPGVEPAPGRDDAGASQGSEGARPPGDDDHEP
jgi:ribosome-binding factor A